LLTFVDQFSKYDEAIPIPNTCRSLCQCVCDAHNCKARHRVNFSNWPRHKLSFSFCRETCRILGIKQLHSSALHPQDSGVVEKYHLVMNQGLSHYVNASGTNWDPLIHYI
jgi:hypothetical protein